MDREKAIKILKDRFQFLVVIAMFFPIILEALFKMTASDLDFFYKNLLSYGIIIFFFICSYILIELLQKYFLPWIVSVVNWLLLFTIGVTGF